MLKHCLTSTEYILSSKANVIYSPVGEFESSYEGEKKYA